MKLDVYGMVTSRIIEQLEQGIIPWEKPWTGTQSGAISGATGRAYSLLNQMLLGRPGVYFTFKQVKERGGSVKKGEKSQTVVFWKQIPVKEQNENGETVERLVPVLKYYNVFHFDQCTGLKPSEQAPTEELPEIRSSEEIISQYQRREEIVIEYVRGDEACYSPGRDRITLPLREQFKSAEEFYSTAFHEMTHSTGHAKRLNRLKSTAHFGNEEYSREELVAEIGAAALMNHTGAETTKSFRNSAAYIQSWLKALRNDSKMVVQASGQAARAVDFILGIE